MPVEISSSHLNKSRAAGVGHGCNSWRLPHSGMPLKIKQNCRAETNNQTNNGIDVVLSTRASSSISIVTLLEFQVVCKIAIQMKVAKSNSLNWVCCLKCPSTWRLILGTRRHLSSKVSKFSWIKFILRNWNVLHDLFNCKSVDVKWIYRAIFWVFRIDF